MFMERIWLRADQLRLNNRVDQQCRIEIGPEPGPPYCRIHEPGGNLTTTLVISQLVNRIIQPDRTNTTSLGLLGAVRHTRFRPIPGKWLEVPLPAFHR